MILVTGVKGQLGYDVCRELESQGIINKGIDIDVCDLTNQEQINMAFEWLRPDAVVHCAAYTAVDKAESDKERCYAVNVDGTRNVANACHEYNAKMIYISTDYVFNGTGTAPWEVDSPKDPINYYGLTKSMGEDIVRETLDRHFIIRTSWVFGKNGNNFVKTMLRLGKERDVLRVVNDQIGSPTYTVDLAKLLVQMVKTDSYGVYHATNSGYCSWCEFTRGIMHEAELLCKVEGISTAEYPTAASRPINSRLSNKSLIGNGFEVLPTWEDSLGRYLAKSEVL
jgi:dTDP-4-dehydrorhamnose reductase